MGKVKKLSWPWAHQWKTACVFPFWIIRTHIRMHVCTNYKHLSIIHNKHIHSHRWRLLSDRGVQAKKKNLQKGHEEGSECVCFATPDSTKSKCIIKNATDSSNLHFYAPASLCISIFLVRSSIRRERIIFWEGRSLLIEPLKHFLCKELRYDSTHCLLLKWNTSIVELKCCSDGSS